MPRRARAVAHTYATDGEPALADRQEVALCWSEHRKFRCSESNEPSIRGQPKPGRSNDSNSTKTRRWISSDRGFDPRETRRSFRRSPRKLRAPPAVTAARCTRRHDITRAAQRLALAALARTNRQPTVALGFDVSGTPLFKKPALVCVSTTRDAPGDRGERFTSDQPY
jgi:hypothetical protein